MAEKKVEVSEADSTKRKVEAGDNTVPGAAPGTAMKKLNVTFEDLGNLDDFVPVAPENTEGVGEKCIVLSDFFCGAYGIGYKKGSVVRLSKLINGYDDAKVDRNIIKAHARRLLELGDIRKATPEEQGQTEIVITAESESDAVQEERTKRVKAQEELAALKLKHGIKDDEETDDSFEG